MPGSSKYYTFPVRTTLLYPSDPSDAITAAKTRGKWLVEIGRLIAVLESAAKSDRASTWSGQDFKLQCQTAFEPRE